ncbi:MAG: L,D-transpeptidase [Candidatus Igneacidithiobacillus chanchocoensis]
MITAPAVSSPAPAPINQIDAAKTRDILIRLRYLPLTVREYLGPKAHIHQNLQWDFSAPAILRRLSARDPWSDPFNPWVMGALYQFEAVHNLPILHGSDGIRGLPPVIVKALLAAKKPDPDPWIWVLVSKFPRPETMRVFVAGHGWVYQSVCNTGVLHATPNGTWPIYARALQTKMVGNFPIPVSNQTVHLYQAAVAAGYSVPPMPYQRYHHHWVQYQKYDDSDIRWVNYFYRGRALHFYPRAAYGFPQSAGCVELPRAAAKHLYTLLHYGVPVSIIHRLPAQGLQNSTVASQSTYVYREIPVHSSTQSVQLRLVHVSALHTPTPSGTPKPITPPPPGIASVGSPDPDPAA